MFKEFYSKYKSDMKQSFNDLKQGRIKKQIPNLLTASRLFAPFFIIPAAFSGNLPLAIFFTAFFELTDAMDGFAARKLNAVSEFGKDLDPVVDKIFATVMCIPVVAINPIMILNIALEGLIASVNTKSKLKGNVPRTTVLGKFKTAFMSLAIALSYICIATNTINPAILSSFLIGTLVVQGATVKQYYDIDCEKDLEKENKENIMEAYNVKEESTFDKVKRYSRANEISELKKLKEELLNTGKQEEKIKIKKK